jgi:hypothetical protein
MVNETERSYTKPIVIFMAADKTDEQARQEARKLARDDHYKVSDTGDVKLVEDRSKSVYLAHVEHEGRTASNIEYIWWSELGNITGPGYQDVDGVGKVNVNQGQINDAAKRRRDFQLHLIYIPNIKGDDIYNAGEFTEDEED